MPRGRPFAPGNRYGRGRPKGSRNKSTQLCTELLAENAQLLTRKCIVMAAQGDRVALRLCMDRLLPLRRAQPVSFRMPRVQTAADIAVASETVLQQVAGGSLTPDEGQQITGMLELRRRALESAEFERRLEVLERERARS